MKENKFFGIFNYKEHLILNHFSAFKGKIDNQSEVTIADNITDSTGLSVDELGKSSIKLLKNLNKNLNNEIILVSKIYVKKYHPNASDDTLIYAYQKQGKLFCGQYSWLQQTDKLSLNLGYFSVLAFGKNSDIIMDRLPQIEDFYTQNNQIPPTKKELETSFQRIKHAKIAYVRK